MSTVCVCSGEFTVGDETYSVEPVMEKLSGDHKIYKESQRKKLPGECGYDGKPWFL